MKLINDELEALERQFGLTIERDRLWEEKPFSDAMMEIRERRSHG